MQADVGMIFAAVAQFPLAVGVAGDTFAVEHEHPYQALIETADAKACDLIVMASHGHHDIAAIGGHGCWASCSISTPSC